MKHVFIIVNSFFISTEALSSRCGLSIEFSNKANYEREVVVSIDWEGMEEIANDEYEGEDSFPGDVPHAVQIAPNGEKSESMAFPCGYLGDPK